MTLVLARVDQKLIHGQVVLSWVPFFNINAIVVADREAAVDSWLQKAVRLALPAEIKISAFVTPDQLAGAMSEPSILKSRVFLLFKDLVGVKTALSHGFSFDRLNLGNLSPEPSESGVHSLSEYFHVTREDLQILGELTTRGVEITLQITPHAKAIRWLPAGSAGLEPGSQGRECRI